MRKLISCMRNAIDHYDLISEGDRIAVGVSGGKDSLALLYGLAKLREYYPKHFSLKALTLDPCFLNEEYDYSQITRLCDELNVQHIIRRSELYEIIFVRRRESNPCSLCARMRRGILHEMAVENGCNVIALGHHMDDAAETFYMNLLSGGNIDCFSPKTYLSRRDIHMIRPMIYATENMVAGAAADVNLPVVKSKCPIDGCTNRQDTKELIKSLSQKYPSLKQKTIGAMERGKVSGWYEKGANED